MNNNRNNNNVRLILEIHKILSTQLRQLYVPFMNTIQLLLLITNFSQTIIRNDISWS